MKIRVIRSSVILCLLCVLCFSVLSNAANDTNSSDIESWGKYLNSEYNSMKNGKGRMKSENEIYEKGKDACISKADIEKGMMFYQAQGMDAAEAKDASETYFEESEALYIQAIEKGYSVTEEEIEEHLANLKAEFESDIVDEESKKQFSILVEQFESESDYWNYEKQIYAKMLPVQKYVNAMEMQYFEEHPDANDEEWINYFENHKKELVKKENFQKQ